MTNSESLNDKINAITLEHNFKKECATKLEGIKSLCYITDGKGVINIYAANENDFKKVLALYPPTNTRTTIGTATDKFYAILDTPFRVNLENPCQPAFSYIHAVTFGYMHNDTSVKIKLPISFIIDFVTRGERAISDSEHHYFIGVSYRKLAEIRVLSYSFKFDISNNQISWYGGDKTCLSIDLINKILEHLNK